MQASRDFICIFQQLLLNYSGLEFSLQSEISLCSVTRGIAMDISRVVGILGPKKIFLGLPLFVRIRKNQEYVNRTIKFLKAIIVGKFMYCIEQISFSKKATKI